MADMMDVCRRHDYLKLLGGAPANRRDVAEELGKSPSTARKHLRELEGAGLVKRTNDGYLLTAFGEVASAKIEEAEATTCSGKVLEHLQAPTDVLSRMRYSSSERGVPHEPVEELAGHVSDADGLRGLTPGLFPRSLETYHELILDGLEAEFVVERDVFEYLRSEHADKLDKSTDRRTHYYVTDDELRHGVALLDEYYVGVLVYDDNGGVVGYAHSDSGRVREYYESVFEDQKDAAERYEP
jgi:predicted transcriptional regulator